MMAFKNADLQSGSASMPLCWWQADAPRLLAQLPDALPIGGIQLIDPEDNGQQGTEAEQLYRYMHDALEQVTDLMKSLRLGACWTVQPALLYRQNMATCQSGSHSSFHSASVPHATCHRHHQPWQMLLHP